MAKITSIYIKYTSRDGSDPMPDVLTRWSFQMLMASRELHKYFHDCKDTLQRVSEKARGVSDELGRDALSVGALQRKHHTFMQDLTTLQHQVPAPPAAGARRQRRASTNCRM